MNYYLFKIRKALGLVPEASSAELETWVVSWYRRYGSFSGDVADCYRTFTDETSAQEFAEALRKANKLIGNTSQTEVDVKFKIYNG